MKKEKKLISELEWIKGISDKIDTENHNWMRKYMELKINYEAQENDRQVLLNEVVIKKKRNAILYSQIEEYKQLFKMLTEDEDPKSMAQSQLKEDQSSHMKSQLSAAKNKPGIDFSKIDHTSQHLAREKLVLDNLASLLEREKKRYHKLKHHFDTELLRQTPLEEAVRHTVRDFVRQSHIKQNTSYSAHIKAAGTQAGQQRELEHDDQFYRIGLTAPDRRDLVDRILSLEKVSQLMRERIDLTDKIKQMPEFDNESN